MVRKSEAVIWITARKEMIGFENNSMWVWHGGTESGKAV